MNSPKKPSDDSAITVDCTQMYFKLGVKYVYQIQYNSQISSWLQDASGSQVDTLDKKNKPSIQDKVSGNHMQQFIVRDITLNCDIINHNYNKVGKER